MPKIIMLEFTNLYGKEDEIAEYLKASDISFCDISVGVKYMWREDFKVDYCIYNDTLIMKESCLYYTDAFYYPIGKDIQGCLEKIEEYVACSGLPLKFCCIDNLTAEKLSKRYPFITVNSDRNWSDYIYDAESFKTFSGKKYSGQRNHVNKFNKLYPNAKVKVIDQSDHPNIKEFLERFERGEDYSSWSEIEEEKKVFDLVSNMERLNQFGICVYSDGKVISFSVGEKIKDTLIVHIEKGLKEYEGIYPFTAQAFVKAFGEKVKYINREEDCGDAGLRTSKLQYHPIEIKDKNTVTVNKLTANINLPIEIKTQRLVIGDIVKKDAQDYFELYTDEKLNEFWGYDYREDLSGELTQDYFYEFQKKLKEKGEEYSLAIKYNGTFIGELVLWEFDFFGGVEIGFRIKKEFQGKGYAFEGASALIDYLRKIKATKIKCRAFKKNISSLTLIKKLGFNKIKEDEEKYYFSMV